MDKNSGRDGSLVECRDRVTDELYFSTAMHVVPEKDSIVEWTDTDEQVSTYEVKGFKYKFRQPLPVTVMVGGVPEVRDPTSQLCPYVVCLLVNPE